MAALPRGKMSDLLLKAQSDFVTAASGNYARTYVYSMGLGETFGLPDDPLLNPPRTNDRDPTAPAPDVHRWAGKISAPLDHNHIGLWLKMLLGSPSTSGASDYEHVFTSGAAALDAYSFEEKLRSAATAGARYRRHLGVMAEGMTLRMGFTEGYSKIDMDLVGRSEEDSTGSSGGGTPTAMALSQVPAVKGLFRISDVAYGELLSLEATYKNNLEPLEYVSDDEFVSGFEPGDTAFTGQARIRYKDETLYDYARASTALDVEFEWKVSATLTLILAAPKLRLEKATREVSGPGGIELTFPFRAEQDVSAAMLTATLKNQVASY